MAYMFGYELSSTCIYKLSRKVRKQRFQLEMVVPLYYHWLFRPRKNGRDDAEIGMGRLESKEEK